MSAPRMKCPHCNGTGDRQTSFGGVVRCELCEGTGQAVCGEVFNAIGDDCTLVFKFPTKEAALQFKSYMSDGGGEYGFLEPQDMLLEDGDLRPEDVVREFWYHTGDNTIIVR